MIFRTDLPELLTQEFLKYYPEVHKIKAQKCMSRYVWACLVSMASRIQYYDSDLDSYQISTNEIRWISGKLQIQNNRKPIYDIVQEICAQDPDSTMQIFDFYYIGHTGTNSRLRIMPRYREKVMQELTNPDLPRLTPQMIQDIKKNYNVETPVNPESLQSFITKTQQTLRAQATKNTPYAEALTRNISMAQSLQVLITQDAQGRYFLPECYEQKDSGRCYARHLALQTVKKEVRHAALGACYLYDFKAHSFAVMASELIRGARTRGLTLEFPAIRDYVNNRKQIRELIARHTGIPVEKVKSIFTSLGFGAQMIDNPYRSIRAQVTQAQYQALNNNILFRHILTELTEIRQGLLELYNSDEFTLNHRTFRAKCSETGTTQSKAQRLAWIYQNIESETTLRFCEMVLARYPEIRILLTVHDGIYLDKPIPSQGFLDIRLELRQQYCYVDIDREVITPLGQEESTSKSQRQAEQEHQHRCRIQAEEMVAHHALL